MSRNAPLLAGLNDVPRPAGWMPDPIPELRGETEIYLDSETTGLDWWDSAEPVGWAYLLPESGRRGYLPGKHPGGGNHDPDQLREWRRRELRNIRVINAEMKFDAHISREDGVDLTEQGCVLEDIEHHAALLDDHRMRFNLNQLAHDFLGPHRQKLELPALPGELPAWQVAPYAVEDVQLVHDIRQVTLPLIRAENLEEVLALECDVLPVVVEMETNGTYLDLDTLEAWRVKATAELEGCLWEIYRQTGVMLTTPDSPTGLKKLFDALKITITATTATGQPSFTAGVLRAIQHPVVRLVEKAGQLADLKSKYLDKYARAADADGWLRFNLHQLRNGKDEDSKKGTVSGRFSAAGDKRGGYNPQQVVAVEKQLERGWCPDYVIRKLFVPGSAAERRANPQRCWVAADAMQIEYRLFAHYANTADVIETFRKNPRADYHKVVQELLNNPALNRKLTKNTNFAKIYGAGLIKFSFMIGKITEEELEDAYRRYGKKPHKAMEDQTYGARVREAFEVNEKYDARFPAVKPLLRKASNTAEQRGYVCTLVGRRARLIDRFHSALNRIIQGGAADINKRVTVEAFRQRKRLGLTMYITVHDELDGALEDPNGVAALQEVLDTQYYDLRVPILWDAQTGPTWGHCK